MDELQESFFNQYSDDFAEYFIKYRAEKLCKREDYKEIEQKISEIKKQNPNVQTFLEDGEAIDLTDVEENALYDILKMQEDRDLLEKKECFKLGFKEAYIFLKEMNLLK